MENSVKIEITYEQFENMFVTAFEGGSNYWAVVDTSKITGKPDGEPWSTYLAKKIWEDNFKLAVFDREEGDFLGYFTKTRFLKHASKQQWALNEMITETMDANSADALFQLGTMAEVVFG